MRLLRCIPQRDVHHFDLSFGIGVQNRPPGSEIRWFDSPCRRVPSQLFIIELQQAHGPRVSQRLADHRRAPLLPCRLSDGLPTLAQPPTSGTSRRNVTSAPARSSTGASSSATCRSLTNTI